MKEQALRHNLANTSTLLNQLPVLVWQTDTDLRLESMYGGLLESMLSSSSAVSLLGRTVSEISESYTWLGSPQQYIDAILNEKNYSSITYQDGQFFQIQITPRKETNKVVGVNAILTAIDVGSSEQPIEDILIYRCAVSLPSPTIVVSASDNVIEVANEQFIKVFKYDKEEVVNESLLKFIEHIDLSLIRSRTRRIGLVRTIEFKMRRFGKHASKVFWVKAMAQTIEIKDKKYLFIQLTDITKNKQNEEKWKSLITSAPDYILHVDMEGHIQYINRTPKQVNVSKMMGENVHDLVEPSQQPIVKRLFEHVADTHVPQRFEGAFYNYNTQTRSTWLSVRVAPMLTDNEMVGFALIASDITRIKRNREQLSQSEARNKVLLETIPDQIFLISKNGIVLDYKADRQDYYNLTSPLQQHISKVLPPIVANKVDKAVRDTLKEKVSQTIQYNYLSENNELVHLEARTNLSTRGEVLMIVRNVSEQKRNEEAIRKSQQEYRQLLNNIDEIVYAVSLNTFEAKNELTFISEHLESVLSYPLHHFDKHTFIRWIRSIHPQDRRRVVESTKDAIYSQQKVSRHYRILHHTENRYVWLEERINPKVDNLGNLIGYLGVARDITREKTTKEEKQRLISLIGSSHEFIGMTDETGLIKFVNNAGLKLLGVEHHTDIMNANILDYFTRSVRAEIALEVFEHPRYNSWETEVRIINRRKYMPLDVAVSFFPIKLGKNQPTSIAVVMRDISERKRSERKIKQSEQKYRTLIDTMREGIIVLNSEDEIVYVNDRVLELLGNLEKEIIGRNIKRLLFPTHRDPESYEILENRLKIVPEQYELQLKRKNGQSLWAWVSSNPIRAGKSDSFGTILAIADISSLKTAQDELLSVNKEMEQLLYRASHDLKGPISSVEGVLNLLRIEKTKDEIVQKYTDMIDISVRKLGSLIKDLTKVSSIKQGKLNVKIIDFEQLIHDIIPTFSFYENYANVTFNINIQTKKGFCTDESLLYTVLQNFIENGIKYSKRYFDSAIVQIMITDTSKGVEIEVLDNGIGIPESHQTKIFDMFVRASEQAKGSGLGLYIAHNAIKKLGGTISMESKEDEGSIFVIQLPSMPSEEE